MAKDYSFDVVCRTDMQEVANAVNQASKEIGTRYDFKGSKSSVTLDDGHITLIGDDDFKLRLVREIINGKLVKRSISLVSIIDCISSISFSLSVFPFTIFSIKYSSCISSPSKNPHIYLKLNQVFSLLLVYEIFSFIIHESC